MPITALLRRRFVLLRGDLQSTVARAVTALSLASCAPVITAKPAPEATGPRDETPLSSAPFDAAPVTSLPVNGTATPTPSGAPAGATKEVVFEEWLRLRLPEGGSLVEEPFGVVHTLRAGESTLSVARAYLGLTDVYFAEELARDIGEEAAARHLRLAPGAQVPIPHLLTEPYLTGDAERARLPRPEDGALRGLYIRGATVTRHMFPFILEQMAARGINAVVLDAKDYDGPLTYPSKVPLARETNASQGAPIADLARVIRFVHAKGVRVIMRVSCFNDEFMAKARPDLSVQAKWGRPYPIGWLDPSNVDAQDYLLALVDEVMDAGSDEVQLDYVRFPVLGIKGADFHLEERGLDKVTVIRDFVRRVHGRTRPRHVPLSLDVFGVVAHGHRVDIEALGQDLAMLAPECEALSPMVYPSHYAPGFNGWDHPGDHPEIVGIGVAGSLAQLAAGPHPEGTKLADIRPWLQAMNYRTTTYGPAYLQEEIRAGDAAGGRGWLMWNPGQEYGYAWTAVPKLRGH